MVLTGSPALPPTVIAAYAQRLYQQYGRLDLDALTPAEREEYLQIQLRAVFVEPSVREDPPPVELPKELWEKLEAEGEIRLEDLPSGFDLGRMQEAQASYYGRPLRRVLDVLVEDVGQHVVVLGDPGAGKSTLARYLALSLLEAAPDSRIGVLRGHLPLLVELRTYARVRAEGKAETFIEFLGYLAETEGYPFTAGQLEEFLRSGGRALVIFDGLDELFDPAVRELTAERIAGFAARYPAARVLVTSRIIGYRRAALTDSGFAHYTLQDLSEEQIGGFLATWYGLAFHGRDEDARERRQRLLRAVTESRSIRELAGNPMLLTILAIIGKGQELPRERWKLYDHAATVLVQHWDVNKHLRDERVDADFIGEDDKKELLRRVANRMQAGIGGLAGNHFPADQLQTEFESYLRDRYQRDSASAKVIAAAMIRQFRERNFILSRYGASIYGFVHRAFLEFFCADYYVQQFEKIQELSMAQLKQQVFAEHWADPAWREVLRLITGRIAERFAAELIHFLARDSYQPWPQYFQDNPPRNIALAVQCLGEVNSTNAVHGAATELVRVITELLMHSIATVDQPRDALFQDELVPAIRIVGTAWPGRELYGQWYQKVGNSLVDVPLADIAAQIVGILLPDSENLREMLQQLALTGNDYRKRAAGLVGLIEGWADDPATRALLYDRALNDQHRLVRQTATMAIYDRWPTHADTFRLLGDRGAHDPSKDVRQAALLALSDGWAADERVLTLLCEIGMTESDPDVKESAREKLRTDPAARGFLVDRSARHVDVDTRRKSVTLITSIWPREPEIFLLLCEWASDSDPGVRRVATAALGNSWADRPELFALLRERANDHDWEVRRAAVAALGNSWADRPETFALLRERANDSDPSVRLATVAALSNRGADAPDTLALLRARADDRDWQVRRATVAALGDSWADRPETLALLRERATDSDPGVRLATVAALGSSRANDPATLARLRERANDRDSDVRQAAVTALGNSRADDPETLALLRKRANDSKSEVSRAAVAALGNSGANDPETLALLHARANDRDSDVRRAAVAALGNSRADRPETLALLHARANDRDSDVRRAAVAALGNSRADRPETLALLHARANDRDSDVRQAAVTALGNSRADRPETLALLHARANDSSPAVRQAAVTALGNSRADRPETLALLHARANDSSPAVRQAAVTALGNSRADDPQTLALLRERANDSKSDVRLAAVTALGNSGNDHPETLGLLRRHASSDQALMVRQAAARAILHNSGQDS